MRLITEQNKLINREIDDFITADHAVSRVLKDRSPVKQNRDSNLSFARFKEIQNTSMHESS